ncbi:leucine-rich repeat protein, partial [Tanacetum coccineum]
VLYEMHCASKKTWLHHIPSLIENKNQTDFHAANRNCMTPISSFTHSPVEMFKNTAEVGSVFKHSGATTFVPAAVYGVVALNRAWTLELIWFSGDVLSGFSSTPSAKAWLRKTVERPHERLALLKFKHSVYDGFDMLSSWVGNDCCEWERVHCDKVTGKVDSLHLRGRKDGIIRAEYLIGKEVITCLKDLRHLKFLDLSGNDFQGSRIPEFIGSFKQLSYLNLSNAFSGIIPPRIGNLSNLVVLDLKTDPEQSLKSDDMSWISGLSSLKSLDLSYVDLSKAQNRDMVFYMMPSLLKLSLSHCGLTNADLGTLSNSSTTLANIKHLDLGYNHFKGQFPAFFQNMTSLEFLDLSNFNFQPFLLSMICSFPKLRLSSCELRSMHLSSNHFNSTTISIIQHLDLSQNLIDGRFPSVLINMSSLLSLDLSNNMLSSSVPIMLNLRMLDLSGNNFKQIEDVGIWRQCHLKELRVSSNQFEIKLIDSPKNISECSQYSFERLHLDGSLKGAFPADSFGRMVNLRGLHLSYNGLTGPIPESLGRLRLLEELDLHNNQLTGPIPESLGRLRLLEELDLSYNQLTGPIPTFVGGLTHLDLSDNLLNGSIPESFGSLTALTYLDLSYNQLTGHVPTSLGRLVSLQLFRVYSNSLNGTVPVSIGQLTKLKYLDISENSLEGVITEAHLAKLSMLKYLLTSSNSKLTFNVSREWKPPFQLMYADLSSSKIINGFPEWLRTQKKLRSLRLSNASITGPLPTWLRKMPLVSFLDLSHNKLSGPLTNLPNEGSVDVSDNFVKALFLQDNLFNESIPISLCRRIDLEYLNLARNRLSGKLPNCLGNMRNLYTMQFSSNQLSGVVPSSILSQSSTLRWLNLNDNQFTGELPQELGNLRELQILDLGDNGFSGNLSEWIGENLTNLRVFRLHKNNFTGSISRSLKPVDWSDPFKHGALNFLSHLNFVHKQLVRTNSNRKSIADPTIINLCWNNLCGAPLPKNCSNNEDQTTMHKNSKAANHKSKKIWFYMDIMCGFAAGFWGVIGVLLLKKHWRHKLFMFAEETVDKIYVAVVLRFDR